MATDPLIKLFKEHNYAMEILGRVWELLYIEGNAPDIGKRRENFIKLLIQNEFNLEVEGAPDIERDWDFKVKINNKWYFYSLKTTERISTIKVAWNGFPSYERAELFIFKYPILYITGDRASKMIEIYVFTPRIIDNVKSKLNKDFWWIPRTGTNPRGFGISTKAIRKLMNEAKKEGNYVSKKYNFTYNIDEISKDYWKGWYILLKKLAGFSH